MRKVYFPVELREKALGLNSENVFLNIFQWEPNRDIWTKNRSEQEPVFIEV